MNEQVWVFVLAQAAPLAPVSTGWFAEHHFMEWPSVPLHDSNSGRLLTARRVVATLAGYCGNAGVAGVAGPAAEQMCWRELKWDAGAGAEPFHVPFLVRKCSSVPSKSRGADVKWNHDFSGSSHRRPPLGEGGLPGSWIDSWSHASTKALASHTFISRVAVKDARICTARPSETEHMHFLFPFACLPSLEANLVYVVQLELLLRHRHPA